MSTTRTVRATDFVPLISFLRDDARREVTAAVWPRAGEDAVWKTVSKALSPVVTRPGGLPRAWVQTSRGGLEGLALARPREAGIAWDIEELHLREGSWLAAADLLEQLAAGASRRGARRLFLVTPREGEIIRIAKQCGFVNYTSEVLYSIRLRAPVDPGSFPSPRPRLRHDTHALFQLYNASVPCRVRSAEALTVDEWSALNRDRGWSPSFRTSRRQLVWEMDGSLVGWLKLTIEGASQHMELLIHPSHLDKTEQMVLSSLARAGLRLPLFASVRQYQPDLALALESRGFDRVDEHLVFARELAARIPSRALMPVRA